MFDRFLSVIGILILHVRKSSRKLGVEAIYQQFHVLEGAIDREYFREVFLIDVARETSHVHLGGTGCGTASGATFRGTRLGPAWDRQVGKPYH